jgi:hypothetical protein
MRHILSILDLTAAEIQEIFAVTKDLKTKLTAGIREPLLPGRVAALLFEKPSLRTRVSFETAMIHLGGGSLFLGEDVGWGQRESAADFARVISQYIDVIVCRAKSHKKVAELAQHATCPVINGLTDTDHPCQALADLFTLEELHGKLAGKKVAFVGDANNVARSLAEARDRLCDCGSPRLPIRACLCATARRRLAEVQVYTIDRSRRCGEGRLLRVHGCVGQHGPGKREGSAGQSVCAVSGQRGVDAASSRRRLLPALSAGTPRRRSDG